MRIWKKVTKKILREQSLEVRSTLSIEQRDELSQLIMKQLIYALDWTSYSVVHVFLTSQKLGEINTQPLVEYLWQHHPKITVVTNRLLTGKKDIATHVIKADDELVLNAWSIPEPLETASVIAPKQIDIFIIPLLACDYFGNRLGYGGGFYDRLLACVNPKAARVGVNFFEPLTTLIPVLAYDQSLDYLIAPYRRFDFRTYKSTMLQNN